MYILSSYRLSPENNARIAEKAEALGGSFVATSFEQSVDSIVEQIEREITKATIFLGGRLSPEQLERAALLRWINVPWAGVNALMSLPGIERRSDIVITNSSGVMADSVADQAMAYLLMLNRNLANQVRWQMRKEWNRYTSVEHPDRRILRNRTLGIVGYGAIGRALAERARAFGMKIVAVKRDVGGDVFPELDTLYNARDLPLLLAESDFVVITLPLTSRTEGMIGRGELAYMKPTACLVNVARGKVVVQSALIQALQGQTIAGAALDVFEEEPLPEDSVFWEMENVILTPHSSGGFVGFGDAVTDLFLKQIDRFVRNLPLENRVDTERGY